MQSVRRNLFMPTLTPDFLANIPIFRGTTEQERSQLLQGMVAEKFAPGEAVIAAGDPNRGLHVITEGSAVVVLDVYGLENPITEADPQIVDHTEIAKLEIGSAFGEVSFFDGKEHTATVKAVTDLGVLTLPESVYREMVEHGNLAAFKIAANAAQILSERLRAADKAISELVLAQHDAFARSNWFSKHLELHSTFSSGGSRFTYMGND